MTSGIIRQKNVSIFSSIADFVARTLDSYFGVDRQIKARYIPADEPGLDSVDANRSSRQLDKDFFWYGGSRGCC